MSRIPPEAFSEKLVKIYIVQSFSFIDAVRPRCKVVGRVNK